MVLVSLVLPPRHSPMTPARSGPSRGHPASAPKDDAFKGPDRPTMWNGKHIRAAKKAHTQGHHVRVGNCMCVTGMGEQVSHVGCFRWELRARSSHPPMFNTPQKHRKTECCSPGCRKPSCDAPLIQKAIGTKVLRRGSLCDSVNQICTDYPPPSTEKDGHCNDLTPTAAPLHPKLDTTLKPGALRQRRVHKYVGDTLHSVSVRRAFI